MIELFAGGSGWIRTTEAKRNRFTVCPLWPLGNASAYEVLVAKNVPAEISSQFISPYKTENGAGGRTRTPDLLITNQLLYQLSYTSALDCLIIISRRNGFVKHYFYFFKIYAFSTKNLLFRS